jgi:glycine cleavage system H lipoate-binding protein
MLTALFVVTVVGALALHHFFIELPREAEVRATPSASDTITLTQAIEDLPGGIFLQPTFTWTRVQENGELFLGVHPLLMSLVGPSHRLELQADASTLTKGTPLLKIQNGQREIQLFSPVAGRILEVNDQVVPHAGWEGTGNWIYRIQPEAASQETPSWLVGDQATEWAHQQYRDIKDFLLQAVSHEEVGLAAADGGELPAGILEQLDPQTWEAFQNRFIPHPE